jgi:hypothetical protein
VAPVCSVLANRSSRIRAGWETLAGVFGKLLFLTVCSQHLLSQIAGNSRNCHGMSAATGIMMRSIVSRT